MIESLLESLIERDPIIISSSIYYFLYPFSFCQELERLFHPYPFNMLMKGFFFLHSKDVLECKFIHIQFAANCCHPQIAANIC